MTAQPSEPSKDNPASECWQLDPLNSGHPARSRICNAWEVMALAIEQLPLAEQCMVILEIERRLNEKGIEKLRRLRNEKRGCPEPPTR